MGSASDNYVLKWNEFHSCVATSFTQLRNAQELFDMTVAVDEHHQLQAHKVILSASSPYFRSMLINNPSQHPVLVMPPHVRPSDLGAVIDFIYQGEVKIPTSELTEFIGLAQMLKIKGLTDDFASPEKEQKRMPPKPLQPKLPPGTQIKKRSSGPAPGQMQPMPPNAPPKRPRMGQNPMMHPPRPNMPQGFIPPPPEVPEGDEGVDEDDVQEVEDEDGEVYGEYDDQYHNNEYPMEGQPGPPPPPPPPTQPMHASHGGPPPGAPGPSQTGGPTLVGLKCPQCQEICYGVVALKSHMFQMHGMGDSEPSKNKQDEKTDACHICDKKFKGPKNVQAHIRRVHKIPGAEQGQEMMDPEGGPMPPGGKVVKKKGRPKKDSSMQQHQQQPPQQPPQVQPGMSRPIGQVSPAPRPPQEMQDMQSRPPVVQQDRGASPMSANRPRPHGMMSPSSSSGPPIKRHPQHNILGPGMAMRPRAPPHQYPHQYPQPGGSNVLKGLSAKLGGAISITSSEHQSPQPLRRPMPSTSRGAHASSPKSDPLATTSRPPLSSQRQDRLSQEVPVEVKQEPQEMDEMYEDEMPEDFEHEEEDFGDEEEEEDGEQEYEEGMYEEGEAPYDDEHEEGSFQQ